MQRGSASKWLHELVPRSCSNLPSPHVYLTMPTPVLQHLGIPSARRSGPSISTTVGGSGRKSVSKHTATEYLARTRLRSLSIHITLSPTTNHSPRKRLCR